MTAVALVGGGGWLLLRPGAESADPSIAVLPFANLSGDPAQAYLSDGIAEELRSVFSAMSGMKVVARASCEAVRDEDAKSAAKKLGVSNILTGSLRRAPNLIRVAAQLVDGRSGLERWSEVYDRPAVDALQIQRDIAGRVAEALSLRIAGSEGRLRQGGTDKPEALDLFLKADALWEQSDGREAAERVMRLVDQALAADPEYGDAAAMKARVLVTLSGSFSANARESQQGYRAAAAIAERAIRLAPESRLGYSVLADILYQQLQPRAAAPQFERMLALPGDDGRTLPPYAVFLSETRRHGEALQLIDRAIGADPLNPHTYGWKAHILACGGHYSDAVEAARKTLELRPGHARGRVRLGYYLLLAGETAEAAASMNVSSPGGAFDYLYRGFLAVKTGNQDEAEQYLARIRALGDSSHYQEADMLAVIGRKDEAIEALEKAWRARDPGLVLIQVDPLLKPLRGNPRLEAIIKRIDFPS